MFCLRSGTTLRWANKLMAQIGSCSHQLGGVSSGIPPWAFARVFVLATLGLGVILLSIISQSIYRSYAVPLGEHVQRIAEWCFRA
ncbi:hypothetical protein ACQUJS_23045, partial [Ralstonia pseudosolanacearum]